jgi:hypothetical protein
MSDDALEAKIIGLLARSSEALGNDTAKRAIGDLFCRARQPRTGKSLEPRVVVYDGGWLGMCEAIGVEPCDENTLVLRQMAFAGQCVTVTTTRYHYQFAGLWTWAASMKSVRFDLGGAFDLNAWRAEDAR